MPCSLSGGYGANEAVSLCAVTERFLRLVVHFSISHHCIQLETATCETCSVIDGLYFEVRQCASFQLDVDNGVRDYITGIDVYSTKMAIIGLTFHTAFGRTYSCPDNGVFIDDTLTNYYMFNRTNGRVNVFGVDPINMPFSV